MPVGNECESMCPLLIGKFDWECVKEHCAWWVASHKMCSIRLQAEMAARAATYAERQAREMRRTVKKE
jgi:hypothetical protein